MAARQVDDVFEAFFQGYPGALVIATPEGEVVAANAAARALSGERLAPGTRLEEHAHPDDGPTLAAVLARITDDGPPARFTCRAREANRPSIAWQVWRMPGRPEVFVTLAPAETASTPAAGGAKPGGDAIESLVLRAILDNVNISVSVANKDGVYTYLEGKALAAAGLSPGQLVGLNAFELFGDQFTPTMRAAFAGIPGQESVKAVGVHWHHWFVPIRDANGEPAGVIGVTQNDNDNQRIREELEARLAVIERQQAVIRDLETPVLKVWDQVLTLPMIGIVDSQRAARVMESLLDAVVRHAARFAILDLTGVEIVDTATASSLMAMIRAIRLLGAEGILTGIRPTVAQTVISLGVDLSGIPTLASLRHGLAYCIRRLENAERKTAT
jgi:rsbT co-antagonist protein RsbR